MPITPTYPGVYIEEIPSGVRTITGVATSITGFVGRALRGPDNEPVRIASFGDYERTFGGLWVKSAMSYGVRQYFLNGGSDAIVVRVENNASAATISLPGGTTSLGVVDNLELEAASKGAWGANLRVFVDHDTRDPDDDTLFNLIIQEVDPQNDGEVVRSETFLNVSVSEVSPRFVGAVLAQDSDLLRLVSASTIPAVRPAESAPDSLGNPAPTSPNAGTASDGDPITSDQVVGSEASEGGKTGLWALEKADLFNLLCIPPFVREADTAGLSWYASQTPTPLEVDSEMASTYVAALAYCKKRRAMLLIDPPTSWNDVSTVAGADIAAALGVTRDENAAVFFPRFYARDLMLDNRLESFAPSGAMAGIFARTDARRGVWKAPAGIEATITGAAGLTYKLTDNENGRLNPLGINCLRSFPVIGRVVWGSRTLEGADQLASEWKYVPVRRIALFIEESLYRGSQWVVFEPNDEPLWAQIRLSFGAFMQNLFRQGAFQGSSPKEAYFVKCDKETTTQNDINLGIVNIVVGFAPLKPAEFVIIKIQQIAGQVEA